MVISRLFDRITAANRRRQVSMELPFMNEYRLEDIGVRRLDIIAGKRVR